MLISLVLLPALGSVATASLGRRGSPFATGLAIACAAASLVLAGWVLWASASSQPLASELRPWIPSLGVSVVVAGDRLSSILSVWVALASVLALTFARPDARTAALVLLIESMMLLSFVAGDVLLVLVSLGGLAVAAALLSSAPRRVLVIESAGLCLLLGWCAVVYGMVYEQTGFVSTELARWHALVLYPEQARSLLLFGASALAWLMLALALATETAPLAGRLALAATAGLLGNVFLVRVVVPVCSPGAEGAASAVLLFAAVLMGSTLLARGWVWLVAGYQGVVVFGLFGSPEESLTGALLMMIAATVGGFGLVLIETKRVTWVFAFFLLGTSIAFVIVPLWAGDPWWAALASSGFSVVAYRTIALARRERTGPERANALLFAAPVILVSLSMVLGSGVWVAQVTPWARVVSRAASQGVESVP